MQNNWTGYSKQFYNFYSAYEFYLTQKLHIRLCRLMGKHYCDSKESVVIYDEKYFPLFRKMFLIDFVQF